MDFAKKMDSIFGGAGAGTSNVRYYVVTKTSIGDVGGRYSSTTGPAAAAKKAATKRFGSSMKLRITVRETGTQKEFSYEAQRVKLDTPVVRTINGKTISTNYRVMIKSIKS